MNVLMIIDSLGIGGAEVSLRTLTRAMADDGHDVVVLVIRDEVVLQLDDRVRVEVLSYRRSRWLPTTLLNAVRLRRSIQELEDELGPFGLKVAHLTLSHRLAGIARIEGVKYCIHEDISESNLGERSGINRFLRILRVRRLYSGKDIVVVSEGVRQSLECFPGLKPASVSIIYNAIDVEAIEKLSAEANPYSGQRYIIHVGRMALREKRHDVLLDAFSKLQHDYRLIMVGDGPDRSRIESQIRQMGLDEKVVLTGFLKNPYPVIRDAAVLVLSSDYEGFGVVLAEALSLGTAVVSTDCRSGPSEIMKSALSGYLVDTGDADALSDKIEQAIADIGKQCYPFQDAGIDRFLPAGIVRRYIDLAAQPGN